MIAGFKLTKKQAERWIPKLAYTRDDVVFAVSSEDIAKRMIDSGMLRPAGVKPLVFDAGDVARAWHRWKSGEQPERKTPPAVIVDEQ